MSTVLLIFSRFTAREWLHLALLLTLVVPLFALRGHWGSEGNPDTNAVAIPAWHFAREGTLDLSGFEIIAENQQHFDRWFVYDKQGRIVSNRAPGLIALAIPAYAVSGPAPYSNAPATAVALIMTTLAVVISWIVLRQLVPLSFATIGAAVLALGTTTWVISASELWPHGPGQFWAAVAAASLASGSPFGVGLAFALSITTRPLTALFPAVAGIYEGWRSRSLGPMVKIGAVSLLGLATVISYNRILFGTWSIRGGYGDRFTIGALERFDVRDYILNVLQMFIGGKHGFLVVTPIVGLAFYGAIRQWQETPGWTRSLGIAALVYLLVHAALNRASAGMTAYYRYPLESIVLAAPLLTVGAYSLWTRGRSWRFGLGAVAGLSVVLVALEPLVLCSLERLDASSCLTL